jgi:hypothetical protein
MPLTTDGAMSVRDTSEPSVTVSRLRSAATRQSQSGPCLDVLAQLQHLSRTDAVNVLADPTTPQEANALALPLTFVPGVAPRTADALSLVVYSNDTERAARSSQAEADIAWTSGATASVGTASKSQRALQLQLSQLAGRQAQSAAPAIPDFVREKELERVILREHQVALLRQPEARSAPPATGTPRRGRGTPSQVPLPTLPLPFPLSASNRKPRLPATAFTMDQGKALMQCTEESPAYDAALQKTFDDASAAETRRAGQTARDRRILDSIRADIVQDRPLSGPNPHLPRPSRLNDGGVAHRQAFDAAAERRGMRAPGAVASRPIAIPAALAKRKDGSHHDVQL